MDPGQPRSGASEQGGAYILGLRLLVNVNRKCLRGNLHQSLCITPYMYMQSRETRNMPLLDARALSCRWGHSYVEGLDASQSQRGGWWDQAIDRPLVTEPDRQRLEQ